jgi:hypothetical protein
MKEIKDHKRERESNEILRRSQQEIFDLRNQLA